MDEKKVRARLRKLSQLYSHGDLTYQDFKSHRNDIIDFCAGLIAEVPEPEIVVKSEEEINVERLEVDETAMRSSSISETSSAKHRLWGFLIILGAMFVSGYAIYIAYS